MKWILFVIFGFSSLAYADFDQWSREFAETGSMAEPSLEAMREAANSGDVRAMLLMAELADSGVGTPEGKPQPEWAFGWLLRAAREGNNAGATRLAMRYFERIGLPEDDLTPQQREQRANARGIFWLNRAAGEYYSPALMLLAELYETGQLGGNNVGVAPDPAKSRELLLLAAANQHPPAYFRLYQLDHRDDASRFDSTERRARQYLNQCVSLGMAECQFEQAKLLFTGDDQSRNVPRGISLLQQAAQQGLVKADVLLQAVLQVQSAQVTQ